MNAPIEITTPEKMPFSISQHQLQILDWLEQKTNENGIINAVAGSGKSTTLKLAALYLMNLGVHPNKILIVVFGKQNQLDLIEKFGKHWRNSIHTLHSLGYQIISNSVGKISKVTDRKYHKLARELNIIGTKKRTGKLIADGLISSEHQFMRLFNLARINLIDFEAEQLRELATHHNLDEIYNFELLETYLNVLQYEGERVLEARREIDYIDMLCLALRASGRSYRRFGCTTFVLVDECQDLNPAQTELVLKISSQSGRLIFVGDPKQAIYGFAGAGCDSFYKIKSATEATELPLSVCYRCPKSHLGLVKRIFPEIPIEPCYDAKKGILKSIDMSEITHKENDLVLSRKTATLIQYCLKLIGQGIAAKVKGRDIGNSLVKEIDQVSDYWVFVKAESLQLNDFLEATEAYQAYKIGQWANLENNEALTQSLEDRLDSLRAIYSSMTGGSKLSSLKNAIADIFTNKTKEIVLCTVHRAKGLEANRVFILSPCDMPLTYRSQRDWQFEQEKNLLYVALTRSKSQLYLEADSLTECVETLQTQCNR